MDLLTRYADAMRKTHAELEAATRRAMRGLEGGEPKARRIARAVRMYKGPWFAPLNAALRQRRPLLGALAELDAALQALLARDCRPSGGCPVLYRSLDGEHAARVATLRVGASFAEPGYSSAAFDPRHALNFGGDADAADAVTTLLVVTVRRSAKFAYVDAFRSACRRGRWAYQSEVLLDRDTTYTVTKKERRRPLTLFGACALDCAHPALTTRVVKVVHVVATRAPWPPPTSRVTRHPPRCGSSGATP
jgi:hypothetical protein